MSLRIESPAFREGATIPARHTVAGPDLSPPLRWSDPPEGTKSFALVCDDPDAPAGTWVHWVLYDLPGALRELPEGVPAEADLPDGSRQGMNDFRRVGYGGPSPPPGKPHRYFFRLYALDRVLGLKPRSRREELLSAMKGHLLSEAQLMGTWRR